MRLLRRLILALVVLVVLVGVGDRATVWVLDRQISASIATLPGVPTDQKNPASVSIRDVPILTSLVDGRLRSVHVTLSGVDLTTRGTALHLGNAVTDLEDVTTSEPHVAASLQASVTISEQDLSDFATAAGLSGTLGIDQGAITVSTTVLGQSVSIGFSPAVSEAGRGFELTPASAQVAGTTVSLDSLSALGVTIPSISVPLDELPTGLTLTSVAAADGGLDLSFVGTDVNVSSLQTAS